MHRDRVQSLVTLGTALPYSRMSGGLPRLIPAPLRAKIRSGDVKEIRFWTGLFNIYRVLQVPGTIKVNTITDPFSGDKDILDMYCKLAQNYNPFNLLDG